MRRLITLILAGFMSITLPVTALAVAPSPAPQPATTQQVRWGLVQASVADWVPAGDQAAHNLGATQIREEMGMTTDVTQFDSRFAVAAANGLRVMPLLNAYNTYPDANAYSQFVAAMAGRFGPGGSFWINNPTLNPNLAVEGFELINEPDMFLGWNPDLYANIVKSSVTAGRAANPQAHFLVYGGGTITGRKHYQAADWVNQMFAAVPDIGKYADAIYAHPYDGIKNTISARNAFIAHGYTLNVWITELGWSTQYMSESQQASQITTWGKTVRSYPWISAFFYFEYRDTASTFKYGLYREDGTAKPAAAAYQNVIAGI